MPRTCTICNHPDRATIEQKIVDQTPYRHIASQHRISTTAIQRHMPHILAEVKLYKQEQTERQAFDVLAQMREINEVARQVMTEAMEHGKGGMALFAIDRLQAQLELQAKLLGMFDEKPQKLDAHVQVILTMPTPETPPDDV